MSRIKLEDRVVALEKQLAKMQTQISAPPRTWLEQIYGAFANDPVYDEAMRLGREYRESLRPKQPSMRRVKSNGHSRHGSGNTARKSK